MPSAAAAVHSELTVCVCQAEEVSLQAKRKAVAATWRAERQLVWVTWLQKSDKLNPLAVGNSRWGLKLEAAKVLLK